MKIILLFLLTIGITKASAQHIEKLDGNHFLLNDTIFNFQELGHHFESGSIAMNYYDTSKKMGKYANILGLTSLGAIAGSIVFKRRAGTHDEDASHEEYKLNRRDNNIADKIFAAACVTGFAGIIFKSRKTIKLKQAIESHNQNLIKQPKPETSQLEIEIQDLGLGLTYNF